MRTAMTTVVKTNVKVIKTLNSLLRGECSAVESYEQALPLFKGQPQESGILRLRDDHWKVVDLLQQHVIEHGGQPALSSKPWGFLTAAVTGAAKLIGRHTTLKALMLGEEHGIHTYENALENDELPEECQQIIADYLLPQAFRHQDNLEMLLASTS